MFTNCWNVTNWFELSGCTRAIIQVDELVRKQCVHSSSDTVLVTTLSIAMPFWVNGKTLRKCAKLPTSLSHTPVCLQTTEAFPLPRLHTVRPPVWGGSGSRRCSIWVIWQPGLRWVGENKTFWHRSTATYQWDRLLFGLLGIDRYFPGWQIEQGPSCAQGKCAQKAWFSSLPKNLPLNVKKGDGWNPPLARPPQPHPDMLDMGNGFCTSLLFFDQVKTCLSRGSQIRSMFDVFKCHYFRWCRGIVCRRNIDNTSQNIALHAWTVRKYVPAKQESFQSSTRTRTQKPPEGWPFTPPFFEQKTMRINYDQRPWKGMWNVCSDWFQRFPRRHIVGGEISWLLHHKLGQGKKILLDHKLVFVQRNSASWRFEMLHVDVSNNIVQLHSQAWCHKWNLDSSVCNIRSVPAKVRRGGSMDASLSSCQLRKKLSWFVYENINLVLCSNKMQQLFQRNLRQAADRNWKKYARMCKQMDFLFGCKLSQEFK